MTIKTLPDLKVKHSNAGEVVNDVASDSGLILKLDTDIQQPWRILKDGSNLVKQITDKAKKYVATVQNANYATYNYNGYFECSTAHFLLNDSEVTTATTLYFRLNNSEHSSEVTQGIIYKKGNLIIRQKANANNLEIEINSSVVVDYAYTHSTTNYYAIFFDGGNVYMVENGIVKAKAAYSGLFATGTTELWGDSVNYFKGNCYSIHKWNYDLFNIDSTIINDNVAYKVTSVIFYKRYENSNIKLYANSRFLKNAEIVNGLDVDRIDDEMAVNFWSSESNPKVELTPQGFYFGTASSARNLRYGSPLNPLNSNFYIGFWAKPDSITGLKVLFTNAGGAGNRSIEIDMNGSQLQMYNSSNGTTFDVSITTTNIIFTTNNYQYISVLRKDDNLFFAYQGVLKLIHALPVGYSFFASTLQPRLGSTYVGGAPFGGYMDDAIVSIGDSLIDPTAHSVGDKVFEPPRRRGLDSRITQF